MNAERTEATIERLTTAEAVLDVLRRFDVAFPRSISSRVGDLALHAAKLHERAFVQVARSGDRILGFAAFYANDRQTRTAFVTHLAVDETCRGLGIGLRLMRACIEASRSAGMDRMKLEVDSDNHGAIGFYAALGFARGDEASPRSCFMILDPL